MEIVAKLLQSNVVEYVFLGVLAVNALLSAVAQGLAVLGKSEKVPTWLNNVALISKKIVDFLSANLAHKK